MPTLFNVLWLSAVSLLLGSVVQQRVVEYLNKPVVARSEMCLLEIVARAVSSWKMVLFIPGVGGTG